MMDTVAMAFCGLCANCVREVYPNATPDEIGLILLRDTSFPACGINTLRYQLAAARDRRAKFAAPTGDKP